MDETSINSSLNALRAGRSDNLSTQALEVAPGVFFNTDPASDIKLTWTSPPGRLLDIQSEVRLPGGWLALHVVLGPLDLSEVGFIGFALRCAAERPVTFRACIRSGIEGGFNDTFFDRYVLAQPEETDHFAMIAPDRRPLMPQQAPWRDFILFLPSEHGFKLAVSDLRLIVV